MITSTLLLSCVLGSATVASSFASSPWHLNTTRNGTAINSTGHATGSIAIIPLGPTTLPPVQTSVLVLPSTESYSSSIIETPFTASSDPKVINTLSSRWIPDVAKPRSSTIPPLATSSGSHVGAALSSNSIGTEKTTGTPQFANSSTSYAITTIGPPSSSSIVRPQIPLSYSNTTSGYRSEVYTGRIPPTGSFYTTSDSKPLPIVTEPTKWGPISNSTQIRVPTSSDPTSPTTSLSFDSLQGSNRTLASLSSLASLSDISPLSSIDSSNLLHSGPTPTLAPAIILNTSYVVQPTPVMNVSHLPALNNSVSISTTISPSVPSGPGTPFRFANFTPNWNDSSYLIPSNARLGGTNSEPLIYGWRTH